MEKPIHLVNEGDPRTCPQCGQGYTVDADKPADHDAAGPMFAAKCLNEACGYEFLTQEDPEDEEPEE